jgi:hypothetical protein
LSSSLPHHPTHFSSWSQDSRIKYPFYSWEISSSFFLQYSNPMNSSWRCSRVSRSSFFVLISSPVDSIQVFDVDHIRFGNSNAFPYRCIS